MVKEGLTRASSDETSVLTETSLVLPASSLAFAFRHCHEDQQNRIITPGIQISDQKVSLMGLSSDYPRKVAATTAFDHPGRHDPQY